MSNRRLEVAGDEAVENGMGHEQDEPQRQDGVGMMVEIMVGAPGSHQVIEPLVFDLPPGVPEANDRVPPRRDSLWDRVVTHTQSCVCWESEAEGGNPETPSIDSGGQTPCPNGEERDGE
jgi:hypothetical protein